MNIDIPEDAKVSDILSTVQGLDGAGHIYCSSERHFSLLKICLIKLQKRDVNIYLLDGHGFTLKQVSAKKRTSSIKPLSPERLASEVVAANLAPIDGQRISQVATPATPQESTPATSLVDTLAHQVSTYSAEELGADSAKPDPEPGVSSAVSGELAVPPSVGSTPLTLSVAPSSSRPEQGLSRPQISAVRDLEQALRRCQELGLLLIGFSDGLVAVPEALGSGADAISSADALEVESFDAYRGYEAEQE